MEFMMVNLRTKFAVIQRLRKIMFPIIRKITAKIKKKDKKIYH